MVQVKQIAKYSEEEVSDRNSEQHGRILEGRNDRRIREPVGTCQKDLANTAEYTGTNQGCKGPRAGHDPAERRSQKGQQRSGHRKIEDDGSGFFRFNEPTDKDLRHCGAEGPRQYNQRPHRQSRINGLPSGEGG